MSDIDITDCDLREVVSAVYDLSSPRGMGFLHARSGSLTSDEIDAILKPWQDNGRYAVCMDYVHGRACKFNVYRERDRLVINGRWYDHSDAQLAELGRRVGFTVPVEA